MKLASLRENAKNAVEAFVQNPIIQSQSHKKILDRFIQEKKKCEDSDYHDANMLYNFSLFCNDELATYLYINDQLKETIQAVGIAVQIAGIANCLYKTEKDKTATKKQIIFYEKNFRWLENFVNAKKAHADAKDFIQNNNLQQALDEVNKAKRYYTAMLPKSASKSPTSIDDAIFNYIEAMNILANDLIKKIQEQVAVLPSSVTTSKPDRKRAVESTEESTLYSQQRSARQNWPSFKLLRKHALHFRSEETQIEHTQEKLSATFMSVPITISC